MEDKLLNDIALYSKLPPCFKAPQCDDHEGPKNKMQIGKSHLKFANIMHAWRGWTELIRKYSPSLAPAFFGQFSFVLNKGVVILSDGIS